MTMTTNPPITKKLVRIPGTALSTLFALRESRLICVMPFFSMICDRKFVKTVKRIKGMNLDILYTAAIVIGLKL